MFTMFTTYVNRMFKSCLIENTYMFHRYIHVLYNSNLIRSAGSRPVDRHRSLDQNNLI